MSHFTTATKRALDALHAQLVGVALLDGKIVTPTRNMVVEDMLAELAEGVDAHLNVTDGEQVERVELLGSGEPDYEIEHQAVLQWVVAGHDRDAIETGFWRGLRAIEEAIAADRTLGGKVADARLADPDITNGRAGEAGRPWKAADLPVLLLFASNRPF